MKVLFVDDDPEVHRLSSLCLKDKCEIVAAHSVQQALELLKTRSDIDCIVCDYSMQDGSGTEVFQYIDSQKRKIPFILCTAQNLDSIKEFQGHELTAFLQKPQYIKTLGVVLESLGESRKAIEEFRLEQFIAIPLLTFAQVDVLPVEVFVKLSESKHVKVFRKGDVFSQEDIKKYQERGVTDFYLDKSDLEEFFEHYLQEQNARQTLVSEVGAEGQIKRILEIKDPSVRENLRALIDSMKSMREGRLDAGAGIRMSEEAYARIRENISKFSIERETEFEIRAVVRLVLETLTRSIDLASTVERYRIQPESYISSHSIVLAHIACMAASKMGWNSELTRYRLALAAFLHDITLKNHALARIRDLGELALKRDLFSADELSNYESHPEDAVALLKKMSQVPPDIEAILLSHHERPDGTGFPKGLRGVKIQPLAAIFIVAHDLLDAMESTVKGSLDLGAWATQAGFLRAGGIFARCSRALAEAAADNPRAERVTRLSI